MKLLALHCNPRLVFCGGHFLTLPSHNNGTKIEMDSDQSYAPHRGEGFLGCGLALIPPDLKDSIVHVEKIQYVGRNPISTVANHRQMHAENSSAAAEV